LVILPTGYFLESLKIALKMPTILCKMIEMLY